MTLPAGAVAKYCDEYVCLWVCLCVCLSIRQDISGTTPAIFTQFLCILPVSVARSSSDTFTKGRIAYRREGVFFPTENALSAASWGMGVHNAGEVCYIYGCVVLYLQNAWG